MGFGENEIEVTRHLPANLGPVAAIGLRNVAIAQKLVVPEVKQLKGNLSGGEKGLLVTLGTISSKAELFSRTVPDIRLIDGQGLVKLVLEHYEQFDSRYRAAVPLKRVYLPAPPDGEAE